METVILVVVCLTLVVNIAMAVLILVVLAELFEGEWKEKPNGR